MKKVVAALIAVFTMFSAVGCTVNNSERDINNSKTKDYSSTYSASYDYNDDNDADDDYSSTYQAPDTKIRYISDRKTQYDNANARQIVFFGLKTESGKFMSASGTASITITDESNYNIYKKDIKFTSKDFTNWSNSSWDSSRYLCGLYIYDKDIQGSSSESGTLSLKVTLDDGTWFDVSKHSISNLPSIQVKIKTPSIPATYRDTRYSSHTSVVQITKLTYTSSSRYDGTASVTFTIILKLSSKIGESNVSDTVAVGYKLYDSDGLVVDSGHIYSDPIAIGESCKDTFNIYDLNPRETYTLKFINAT